MVFSMSKPYTEDDLSDQFDGDLIWRRKELSSMKLAIQNSSVETRAVLLRALVTMMYAHWEGYVRFCAQKYFEHISLKRLRFSELERQIYSNRFIGRLDPFRTNNVSITSRVKTVNDILDSAEKKFTKLDQNLIDTKSNLSSKVMVDICVVCGVDPHEFLGQEFFIDNILLARRNAIAHGRQEYIGFDEIDTLVEKVLNLMNHFRTLLENKIWTKSYLAA